MPYSCVSLRPRRGPATNAACSLCPLPLLPSAVVNKVVQDGYITFGPRLRQGKDRMSVLQSVVEGHKELGALHDQLLRAQHPQQEPRKSPAGKNAAAVMPDAAAAAAAAAGGPLSFSAVAAAAAGGGLDSDVSSGMTACGAAAGVDVLDWHRAGGSDGLLQAPAAVGAADAATEPAANAGTAAPPVDGGGPVDGTAAPTVAALQAEKAAAEAAAAAANAAVDSLLTEKKELEATAAAATAEADDLRQQLEKSKARPATLQQEYNAAAADAVVWRARAGG